MAFDDGVGGAGSSAADSGMNNGIGSAGYGADPGGGADTGAVSAGDLGQALSQQMDTAQRYDANTLETQVHATLDGLDPQALQAAADRTIADLGVDGLQDMAATLDGQYALQALYDAASPTGQATLAEVQQNLSCCTAIDFAGQQSAELSATAGTMTPEQLAAEKTALMADIAQIGLAIGGIFEPTPFCDITDAAISVWRGDWLGAGISAVSVVPYVGDLAKVGKLGKMAETIARAVDIAIADAAFAERLKPALEPIRKALDNVDLSGLPSAVREPLERMRSSIDTLFDARKVPDFADGARHVDPDTGRTMIDVQRGTTGDWNAVMNAPLEPDAIYRTDNGFRYGTDSQRRVAEVQGELKLDLDQARSPYQQDRVVRNNGEKGADVTDPDQGGHFVGRIFGGPGEALNLAPMRESINNGSYGRMEDALRELIEEGNKVEVNISAKYPETGLTRRPDEITVDVTVTAPDGDVHQMPPYQFDNQRP